MIAINHNELNNNNNNNIQCTLKMHYSRYINNI